MLSYKLSADVYGLKYGKGLATTERATATEDNRKQIQANRFDELTGIAQDTHVGLVEDS